MTNRVMYFVFALALAAFWIHVVSAAEPRLEVTLTVVSDNLNMSPDAGIDFMRHVYGEPDTTVPRHESKRRWAPPIRKNVESSESRSASEWKIREFPRCDSIADPKYPDDFRYIVISDFALYCRDTLMARFTGQDCRRFQAYCTVLQVLRDHWAIQYSEPAGEIGVDGKNQEFRLNVIADSVWINESRYCDASYLPWFFGDRLFYVYQRGEQIGWSYHYEEHLLPVKKIFFDRCCEPAVNNPEFGDRGFRFYARDDSVWYSVNGNLVE